MTTGAGTGVLTDYELGLVCVAVAKELDRLEAVQSTSTGLAADVLTEAIATLMSALQKLQKP